MSGITGTQPELLYALSAGITKNTYTTQAAYSGVLGTNTVCNIPAGLLLADPNPVGRVFMLKAWGTIANTAAATFAVNLGLDPTAGTLANTIAVHAAMTPTAATTAPWEIEAWYTVSAFATSTFSAQVNGKARYASIAAGAAPATTFQESPFAGAISAVDPRVTNYIELFGTWSASSVSNTTTLQQMLLFCMN